MANCALAHRDPAPPHLAAHPAGVGLDAGVEPHVPGQHVTPGEASLTDITEIGLQYERINERVLRRLQNLS